MGMSSSEKFEMIDMKCLREYLLLWLKFRVVRTCMLSIGASRSCFAHMHVHTEYLKLGEINSSVGNNTLV